MKGLGVALHTNMYITVRGWPWPEPIPRPSCELVEFCENCNLCSSSSLAWRLSDCECEAEREPLGVSRVLSKSLTSMDVKTRGNPWIGICVCKHQQLLGSANAENP